MPDNFYRAFEDRFRGSRGLIKDRLFVYIPFIRPLLECYPDAKAIDLGCGRGEWLEVLTEQGFEAQGVDLDDGMLSSCRELGLTVCKHEALSFLEGLQESSLALITGFHIAEHIPFDDLKKLAKESLRVLRPGGLLILETPNPENLVVGSSSFYLDPTHERPIPPPLLAFVTEYVGFDRVKILRLNESDELATTNALSLLSVLKGASPDFSVVAQKKGSTELENLMASAFEREYGLSMEALANRFENQAELREQDNRRELGRALDVAQQAQIQVQQAELREKEIKQELASALDEAQQAQLRRIEVEVLLENKTQELQKVYEANHFNWEASEMLRCQVDNLINSWSWRITAPLRWVSLKLHTLKECIDRVWIEPLIRRALRKTIIFLDSMPLLRGWAISLARKFGATVFLRQIYHAIQQDSALPGNGGYLKAQQVSLRMPDKCNELTARASQIDVQLRSAIQARKNKDL